MKECGGGKGKGIARRAGPSNVGPTSEAKQVTGPDVSGPASLQGRDGSARYEWAVSEKVERGPYLGPL